MYNNTNLFDDYTFKHSHFIYFAVYFMYSLFCNNKINYNLVKDKLNEIYNLDDKIEIPKQKYYYNQIKMILTDNTPYNIFYKIKTDNNNIYNSYYESFNYNLMLLDHSNIEHVKNLLICLYSLGLLNDDILLSDETKIFLMIKFRDNHIILSLLQNTLKDNNNIEGIIKKLITNDIFSNDQNINNDKSINILVEMISNLLFFKFDTNVNILHKLLNNFTKLIKNVNEEDIKKRFNIQNEYTFIPIPYIETLNVLSLPFYEYYKQTNSIGKEIHYKNNELILKINDIEYKYVQINQLYVSRTVNYIQPTDKYNNTEDNTKIILFENDDENRIIFEFYDKLFNGNHCYFLCEKDSKYIKYYIKYIIINNINYTVIDDINNFTNILDNFV